MQKKLAKTPRWAKGLAISVLTGLGIGILTIIISAFFFYRHYAAEYPTDTQNLLSALTSAIVVGIGIGAFAAIATGCGYLLSGLLRPGGTSNQQIDNPDQTDKTSDE